MGTIWTQQASIFNTETNDAFFRFVGHYLIFLHVMYVSVDHLRQQYITGEASVVFTMHCSLVSPAF